MTITLPPVVAPNDVIASATWGNVVRTALNDLDTLSVNVTKKYKTSAQTITASTTFVDVIAAGSPATMTFTIAANEVWDVEYWIPCTFTTTGGVKFQLTGPAAPTGVSISATATGYVDNDASNVFSSAVVTAFSSATISLNSSNGTITNTLVITLSYVRIKARIINGANAGTVTLQAAQNSAAGDTVLGLGSFMRAEKVA